MEPTEIRARPYRFGLAISIFWMLYGVGLTWAVIRGGFEIRKAIPEALQAVGFLFLGFGLLGKRFYGLALLAISTTLLGFTVVSEWRLGASFGSLWDTFLLVLAILTFLYFNKRWDEFHPAPEESSASVMVFGQPWYKVARAWRKIPASALRWWGLLVSVSFTRTAFKDIAAFVVGIYALGRAVSTGNGCWVLAFAFAIYWFISRYLGSDLSVVRLLLRGLVIVVALTATGLIQNTTLTASRAAFWIGIFFLGRTVICYLLAKFLGVPDPTIEEIVRAAGPE